MAAGGNYSTGSLIFRFLAMANSIEEQNKVDENFLVYMQKYVSSIIDIAGLQTDSKDVRENAFKLITENYDKYVKFVHRKLGISDDYNEPKEKITKTTEDKNLQNLNALKSITTNKDGSVKGFRNINELLTSVNSIIEKKK